MSRVAKLALASALLTSAVVIWGVHFLQVRERETMYQGVLRDDERRREKMQRREEDLQESVRRRELYERVQSVSKPSNPSGDSAMHLPE